MAQNKSDVLFFANNTAKSVQKADQELEKARKNAERWKIEPTTEGIETATKELDRLNAVIVNQQAELANVVRFAIDRSRLTQEHLDYVIAAVKALYEDRESIPNMRIVWGHNLPMRHFHAFLEPYPNEEK